MDPAVEHHRDPVGDHHRLSLVVGDVDSGDSNLLLQRANIEAHFLSELGVEVGQRLVEQQDVGDDDERPRERSALLLATRKLARVASFEARELDFGERGRHPRPDSQRRLFAHLEAEGHVLRYRHVGEQRVVLENHPDVASLRRKVCHAVISEVDVTGVRKLEAGDGAQGRRLAAPRRAEERHQLAVLDVEVEVVDGDDGTEALRQAAQRDGRHRRRLPVRLTSHGSSGRSASASGR